jgi:hypothetical protein
MRSPRHLQRPTRPAVVHNLLDDLGLPLHRLARHDHLGISPSGNETGERVRDHRAHHVAVFGASVRVTVGREHDGANRCACSISSNPVFVHTSGGPRPGSRSPRRGRW